jgi:Rps23 Pro-64 3,4-dihydroxylase Tpa1-like proline 4-hydroxylase
MNFSWHKVKDLPIVVIDNFYDNAACQKIWQELEFLNYDKKLEKDSSKTGSATHKLESGEVVALRKNKSVFLDDVYAKREFSNILNENRKLFFPDVVLPLIKYHYFFNYFMELNYDSTLLNYYENSDFYKSHRDVAVITAITWFYKTPKKFLGGDLILENELKIECGNNRTVIMPSCINHAVEPIYMEEQHLEQGFGRYSISQFLSHKH